MQESESVEFKSFIGNPTLLANLNQLNIKSPTPIQRETLQPILGLKDLLGMAETGSGKTGAFMIPLLDILTRMPEGEDLHKLVVHKGDTFSARPLVMVMAPTRELALQVKHVSDELSAGLNIKTAALIGGESYNKQKDILGAGVHILVATPGRLIDLYKQKLIDFTFIKTVVLDEADRLLDMGFKDDIYYLLSRAPKNRQILMFTATGSIDLMNMCYKLHSNPVEVNLSRDTILVDNIHHTLAQVGDHEKMKLLVGLLKKSPDDLVLIFCNTKSEAQIVATWLNELGLKAKAITGDLAQASRTKVLKDFKDRVSNILVCTDVAARGLDIKDVNLVINYDLPGDPSNYVHRIGRTGRAGSNGRAISFCAFADCQYLDPIETYIEAKIPKEFLTNEMFEENIGQRPRLKTKKGDSKMRENDSRPRREYADKRPSSENRNAKSTQRDDKPRPKTDKRPLNNKKREEGQDTELRKRKILKHRAVGTKVKKAMQEVLHLMPIKDESLIGHKVIEKGKRSFFGLGPAKKTFEFFIRPEYGILTDRFLHRFFELTPFEINYKVTYNAPTLVVDLNGPDEGFFTDQEAELLDALETVIKRYLGQIVTMNKDLRIQVNCGNYINTHENKVQMMAKRMADKALKKGDMVTAPLSPGDRFIIHKYLEEDSRVSTKSIGNGFYKKIRITVNE